MALPFLSTTAGRSRDRVIAVDLGGRTTKAVHLQRKDNRYVLCSYVLADAPIYEKSMSAELLSEHLKTVSQSLDSKTKSMSMAVGVNDSIVRITEMPSMPRDDMRMVIKLNSKNYLQQDLVNYVYDCHILPSINNKRPDAKAATGQPKFRVLVAGARKQLVDELEKSAKAAGFYPETVFPSLVSPANVFEKVNPTSFEKDVVAIIDLGFKSSSITILHQGEIALNRVVAIGGDKLTNGLAELLNISYAEAEGIKVGMPTEVQTQLENMLLPLGRELRASIDFFEHQFDKAVQAAYVTGGSARSEFILQRLQQEIMVDCQLLNPATFLTMQLPPQQAADVEQLCPQLTVALGAALAAI